MNHPALPVGTEGKILQIVWARGEMLRAVLSISPAGAGHPPPAHPCTLGCERWGGTWAHSCRASDLYVHRTAANVTPNR